MANWADNSPDETTNYITVLTNLRDRDKDAAKSFVADPTNPGENFFRFNRSGNKFQEYLSGVWTDKVLSIAGGGTGASSASGIRSNLGLGTMSLQNDNAVNISGGTIGGLTNVHAENIGTGLIFPARLGNGVGGAGNLFLADNQTWQSLPAAVPIGAMFMWSNVSLPTGYIHCLGGAISRSTYSTLFALIGTIYGAGDGSTTFNLPDFGQRFPLGIATFIGGTGAVIGERGGQIDHVHQLATDFIGAHSHTVSGHQHTTDVHSHGSGTLTGGSHNHGGTVSGTTSSAGSHDHTFSDSFSGTTGGPSTGGPNPSGSGTDRASISHTHSFSDTISGTTSSDGSHTHTYSGTIPASSPGVTGSTANGGGGLTSQNADSSSSTAGNHSHTGTTDARNPPYLAIYFIIKVL